MLHIGLVVWLFGAFHNVELQQNGDNITTIALATFQTLFKSRKCGKAKALTHTTKKQILKREVKEQGKLAKQRSREALPPTTAPKAKPDEKAEEDEIIQTLSYKNGDEY